MVKCQNCSTRCEKIIDYGRQPICNRNLLHPYQFKGEKKYPLGLWFCPNCTLVQQPQQLPTNLLFPPGFNYLSSSSKSIVRFYEALALRYKEEYSLTNQDCIVEIASNDGVFLKPLHKQGIPVKGVDPAKIAAERARHDGIPTIIGDFTSVEADVKEWADGRLKLLCAFDVLAHTGSINRFLYKVKDLLQANPNAIFISQSHYLPKLIENTEFDTCYAEHQRFYTVTSLQNLFKRHGLYIYDCEETDFYGGSFLAYASCEPRVMSYRMEEQLKKEKRYGKISAYSGFKQQVEKNRKDLMKLLFREKKAGRKIIGIGQPMKSAVLLNYCKITDKVVDYLTEVNPLKIGTYAPGSHLMVVDESTFLASADNNSNTDALLLSWNLANDIIKKLKENGFNGKFIIPVPNPIICE